MSFLRIVHGVFLIVAVFAAGRQGPGQWPRPGQASRPKAPGKADGKEKFLFAPHLKPQKIVQPLRLCDLVMRQKQVLPRFGTHIGCVV